MLHPVVNDKLTLCRRQPYVTCRYTHSTVNYWNRKIQPFSVNYINSCYRYCTFDEIVSARQCNGTFVGRKPMFDGQNTSGKYCDTHHAVITLYHQIFFLFGPLKNNLEATRLQNEEEVMLPSISMGNASWGGTAPTVPLPLKIRSLPCNKHTVTDIRPMCVSHDV